jgi:hypothetical protein
MVVNLQKGQLMSPAKLALPAVDEIRQANSLFLHFLRSRPAQARGHFGLSARVTQLLCDADEEQIDRAADFPRALFRLGVPVEPVGLSGLTPNPLHSDDGGGRLVLQATLFLSAWNISRTSGYSARMLLRLDDRDVDCLRHSEMRDILQMSMCEHALRVAFDDLDWIWSQLLTESRPECRQRLLLFGLQPDLSLCAPGRTA